MTVMAFFKKRRKARVFLKNLIKKGFTQSGILVRADFIDKGETERMGYAVIFVTEQKMEQVKSLATSLFPETEVELVQW